MKLTGNILREARERKGITINEVSFTTKINVKVLQAMEDGNVDSLPPKTFLRGFVRSYAEYLKLDVTSILQQFQEEMGTTRPLVTESESSIKNQNHSNQPDKSHSPKEGSMGSMATTIDGSKVAVEMKSSTSNLTKIALAITFILVVVVGWFIQKTMDKYESEKNVQIGVTPAPTPDSGKEATPSLGVVPSPSGIPAPAVLVPSGSVRAPISPTPLGVVANGLPLLSPTPVPISANVVSPAPTYLPTPIPTNIPTPTVAPTVAPTLSPTLTPTPQPTEKVIATPAPNVMPVPSVAPSPKPTPKPSPTPPMAPQEAIIEALDTVTITFRIDGGRAQVLNLNRDQIHTLKAKGRISVEVSDGGAINVIHNGRDRGVPGVPGKPVTLKYP